MKALSVMTSEAQGGAEFAAVDMLEALGARGHEVVMLTNQPGLTDGRAVAAREIDLGPKLSRSTYPALIGRSPLLARTMRRELEREWPYDVLILHYKKEQLLATVLPQRLRASLAWAEWGPVPKQLRFGVGRRAYLLAARQTNLVMAVSEGTRDSLHRIGMPLDLIHVVPNALPVAERRFSEPARVRVRTEHGIPPGAFVVGCVSRFHHKKRNDVAVDAVVELGSDDVHLILAGEGEAEADLRRRARPLGDRSHFLPTPGPDITNVCSAFDVSVFCPSPTEGAPLAVIYSMLAARPVVATAAEGVRELITPGVGTIVSPENDPGALAEVLRGYRADPSRCGREGVAGRVRAAQTFAASSVGAQIERLLSATLCGRR